MDKPVSQQAWQGQVRGFANRLSSQTNYYSIQDLCLFLTKEKNWANLGQVIEYLRDYRSVSMKHRAFHQKWSSLNNMRSLADHDKNEVDKLSELISVLQELLK